MRFQIHFHGPFRVATGSAADGLNASYDEENPLPASSLKGLMRAHAVRPLRLPEPLVGEVFGDRWNRTPWSWTDAEITGGVGRIRTQSRIDPRTHTVADGAMFTSGELWPAGASFAIVQRDAVDPDRIELHQAVLIAAARAITALGSDRRRGLGWVSVVPDRPWDDHLHALLTTHRSPR
ncbi:RAMP superfamily CRISPR-associated protein [Actinomadura craniellae]|uniref:RAMP superfamily CRISPR-associated protein n=1 Tax=Actinomadura craniellae TaxID=2231787 RepID=UPI0011BD5491|nr:RAMP superfamily CRISPR-associated protein [Actinomadura craniellae]